MADAKAIQNIAALLQDRLAAAGAPLSSNIIDNRLAPSDSVTPILAMMDAFSREYRGYHAGPEYPQSKLRATPLAASAGIFDIPRIR